MNARFEAYKQDIIETLEEQLKHGEKYLNGIIKQGCFSPGHVEQERQYVNRVKSDIAAARANDLSSWGITLEMFEESEKEVCHYD